MDKWLSRIREHLSLMSALLKALARFDPYRLTLTLSLMLFRSLGATAGFFLIIPLLQVVGFSLRLAPAGTTQAISRLFSVLHLPLTLVTVLLTYVFIISLIALASYAEQIVSTRLQQEFIHHLRTTLYKQILQTKWSFFLTKKMSDLLHGLTTQVQSVSMCNFQLLTLLNNLILISVYTTLALVLSWSTTLVAIACAGLLLSMMLPLHRLTSQSGKNTIEQNQTIFQSITEQLSGLKMIKGSGYEENYIRNLLNVSASLETQNQLLTRVTALTKLLFSCGAAFFFSLLLYIAIHILNLPESVLLILLIIFSRLLPRVSALQQNYQRILFLLPSYCSVDQLSKECLANQEVFTEKPIKLAFNHAITLKNVSFGYQPHSPVILQNVSMTIKKNTTTAIIGPSGIGKSTLADLIIGLLEPTSGELYIDDTLLDSQKTISWRQSVAYVTQSVVLFNASIRQNLQLLSNEKSADELWDALRQVGAADFVAGLSHGLDTLVGDRGICLSGGEGQRIALARALLTKPQLLVLDESTSSLDKQNIKIIQHALKQLHGQVTLLIISHQTEMSDFSDQKITLEKTDEVRI